MNNQESQLLVKILKEIRDTQKLQLDRQAEAFTLQREKQFALVQKQTERHEQIPGSCQKASRRRVPRWWLSRARRFPSFSLL